MVLMGYPLSKQNKIKTVAAFSKIKKENILQELAKK